MSSKLIISLILILLSGYIIAQDNPGARQIALSNSGIASADDVFAVFGNSAGLAQIKSIETGLFHSPSPFGLKELANSSAAFCLPLSFGSVGAGFSTYGFDLFRESKFIIAFGKIVQEKLIAGLSCTFSHVSIKNYGTDLAVCISAGSIIVPDKSLRIGFNVHNISASTYGREAGQIPVILQAGVSYLMNNIDLSASLDKETDYEAALRFGLEYSPLPFFSFRAGMITNPEKFTAGAGINYSFLRFDYAVVTHNELGLTHQAGIIISI